MKKVVWGLLFGTITVNAQHLETQTADILHAEKIFRTAETDTRPELIDGMYTLSLYLSQKLQLPDVRNRKLTLFIGFIVEPDSTLSDIHFIHLTAEKRFAVASDPITPNLDITEEALYRGLNQQAIEVVKAFNGKWRPATKDGLPVRCQYNYPIIINIE